jgi:hypothetical protein
VAREEEKMALDNVAVAVAARPAASDNAIEMKGEDGKDEKQDAEEHRDQPSPIVMSDSDNEGDAVDHSFYISPAQRSSVAAAAGDNALSFKDLLQIAKEMPKWHGGTTCHEFLRTLKNKLMISGLPEREWIRLLPCLFPDKKDEARSEWVTTHVVGVAKDWNTAANLLTRRLQIQDHAVDIQAKYNRCRQFPDESVQDFGERFTYLSRLLNLEDDNHAIIMRFQERLRPSVIDSLQRYIALKRVDDIDAWAQKEKSLDAVIQVAVELDKGERNAEKHKEIAQSSDDRIRKVPTKQWQRNKFQQIKNDNNRFGRRGKFFKRQRRDHGAGGDASAASGDGAILKCRFHPNSTNHTTEQCRYGSLHVNKNPMSNRKEQRRQTQGGGGGGDNAAIKREAAQRQKADKFQHITCFKCNQKGHFANQCPNSRSAAAPGAQPVRAVRQVLTLAQQRAQARIAAEQSIKNEADANASGAGAAPNANNA